MLVWLSACDTRTLSSNSGIACMFDLWVSTYIRLHYVYVIVGIISIVEEEYILYINGYACFPKLYSIFISSKYVKNYYLNL